MLAAEEELSNPIALGKVWSEFRSEEEEDSLSLAARERERKSKKGFFFMSSLIRFLPQDSSFHVFFNAFFVLLLCLHSLPHVQIVR